MLEVSLGINPFNGMPELINVGVGASLSRRANQGENGGFPTVFKDWLIAAITQRVIAGLSAQIMNAVHEFAPSIEFLNLEVINRRWQAES